MKPPYETHPIALKGSAEEIGAELFIQLVLPVIHEAAQTFGSKKELAEFYAGFVGACFGSMAHHFGEAPARGLVQLLAQGLDGVELHQGVH